MIAHLLFIVHYTHALHIASTPHQSRNPSYYLLLYPSIPVSKVMSTINTLIVCQLSMCSLYPSQAIPRVGGHLHTPGHHGDTQGWGALDLSDDQGWAPGGPLPPPTSPWASPFVQMCVLLPSTIRRHIITPPLTLWLRSDVSLIPCLLSHNSIHECGTKFL